MDRKSTATRIEKAAARSLVTAVGAAISNIRVYGQAHKVTRESGDRAAAEFIGALNEFGRLDIVVHARRLFVNGTAVESDISPIQTFCDCLTLSEVQSLTVSPPMYRPEFDVFLGVLMPSPEEQRAAGGFATALLKAGLTRIKVGRLGVRFAGPSEPEPSGKPKKAEGQRKKKPSKSRARSFDLSDELATLKRTVETVSPASGKDAVTELNAVVEELRAKVQVDDSGLSGGASTRELTEALNRVERAIRELVKQTEHKVGGLVADVKADHAIVARIEKDAQEQGVSLNVTREQLLSSLSEIVQESYQPLSAVGGGVELLRSGRLGAVSDAQRDMLAMVADGMSRLEKLAGFLRKISGVPKALAPDDSILREAYGE